VREQSVYAVAVHRLGQWGDRQPPLLRRVVDRLYWPLFRVVETLTGISIDKTTVVGPGLRIHHFGAIVVHPRAVIGRDCTMRHGVTIGERREGAGAPVIGDGVNIGAHAQILGPIRIGDGARIGAMALVLDDVPDGGTVVAPAARLLGP
jgi:serine O-acetyltransferase